MSPPRTWCDHVVRDEDREARARRQLVAQALRSLEKMRALQLLVSTSHEQVVRSSADIFAENSGLNRDVAGLSAFSNPCSHPQATGVQPPPVSSSVTRLRGVLKYFACYSVSFETATPCRAHCSGPTDVRLRLAPHLLEPSSKPMLPWVEALRTRISLFRRRESKYVLL